MPNADIVFLPHNKTISAGIGTNLLDALRQADMSLESPCNGKGTCGKCRVQVVAGDFGVPHADEHTHLNDSQLADGVRLACRCTIEGEGTVLSLDGGESECRILAEGVLPDTVIAPNINKRFVALPPSSYGESGGDLGRLCRALETDFPDGPPLALLRELPEVLNRDGSGVTAVFAGDRLLGCEPGDTTTRLFGVAVDIGTTTLVASLVDLRTGRETTSASMINPQKEFGLDVLTRIHHVKEHPAALANLSALVRQAVDALIGEVCADGGIDRDAIYEVSIAANTTMTHLFLGVDPAGLGSAPYEPVFTSAVTVAAREVSLTIAPFGLVYCLPSVSGYIGGDIVAGILAAGLPKRGETSLLIDIGTNGEIVLAGEQGLYACSCAAGPALEGMNISCGMRAAPGAIDTVDIGKTVAVGTIGDRPAVGICGSGIIDAVAELVKVGAIEASGRFRKLSGQESPEPWHPCLHREGGSRFILAETECGGELAVTQKDIRQVQLAKGAILSGLLALTAQLGIELSTVDRVYVAGAFGCHVRKESLARLGMIPPACLDRVVLLGNSSKSGAIVTLLSREKRQEAARLAGQVNYIELSCYPGYDRLYAECLSFADKGVRQ